MTEFDRNVSTHLVGLVQIVFGVVLAGSLTAFKAVVVAPGGHSVALMALIGVYGTVVMSWIDWHITIELYPYHVSPRNPDRWVEYTRLLLDLAIVVVYTYLLFTAEPLISNDSADLYSHLVGYAALFGFYLIGGTVRRRAYGRRASDVATISVGLATYAFLAILYAIARMTGTLAPAMLNGLILVAAFFIMIFYRRLRGQRRAKRQARKESGLSIGVDVDGVLANQIEGILPRNAERHGIDLMYESVTDWRLQVGDTDIAEEILSAMGDPRYVLSMPVHEGAQAFVDAFGEFHHVVALTSRPPETRALTEQWLHQNRLAVDAVVSAKEAAKSAKGTDWLIDDYIGNIDDYLGRTAGRAILVDQPWNRERSVLSQYVDQGRLFIAMATANLSPDQSEGG